jgi:hypothetical protein
MQITNYFVAISCLQTSNPEKIWNAARVGDQVLVEQLLIGATKEDLAWEKTHVRCRDVKLCK